MEQAEDPGLGRSILCPRANRLDALKRIRVVLSYPSHPGNVGAVARAIKNMGLGTLYLVHPKHFPHEEATARASGAADVLDAAVLCNTLDEALWNTALAVGLTCRRRTLAPSLSNPREAALELMPILGTPANVALVFGNETNGLSTAELMHCNRLVTIPTNPVYSSVNLAQAVQIMAYECRMAADTSVSELAETHKRASFEETEHFYVHLEKTLTTIGFLNPAYPRQLIPRLRRLFGRESLEKEEVDILRGILAAVERKVRNSQTG